MIFKVEGIIFIQPLNPYQGPKFAETIDNIEYRGMLDKKYRLLTGKREYYIDPNAKGLVS